MTKRPKRPKLSSNLQYIGNVVRAYWQWYCFTEREKERKRRQLDIAAAGRSNRPYYQFSIYLGACRWTRPHRTGF